MSDLISREAVRDALQKEIDKASPPFNDTIGAIRCGVRLARNIIEDMPSADAVEVVRCRDCDSAECSGVMIFCLMHGCYMRDNDYCNYGERRDG